MAMDYRGEEFTGSLLAIADAINGQVFHSGGGIFGVRVDTDGHQFFFGFADEVLGGDLNNNEGELIGSGVTDLTITQIPEVIARCQEVIANNEYDTVTAQGHTYRAGDAVIYSVYPSVANGTGVVTDDLMGIRSTGETLAEVTKMGLGDFCKWYGLYAVDPA